ncbi:MAG TPA: hypothetical protein VG142_08740 [Trebonia sp.]|nr:hypothetical protein [Trebonia sp.]
MGHQFPSPARTFSWDELSDQCRNDEYSHPAAIAWQTAGALMFVNGLVLCAYACQDHYWWQWVGMLVAFGIVGAIASHAVAGMVRNGEIDPDPPGIPSGPASSSGT